MNKFILSNSLNVNDVIQKFQLQMKQIFFSLVQSIPNISESARLEVPMEVSFLENSNMLFVANVQELFSNRYKLGRSKLFYSHKAITCVDGTKVKRWLPRPLFKV